MFLIWTDANRINNSCCILILLQEQKLLGQGLVSLSKEKIYIIFNISHFSYTLKSHVWAYTLFT